MSVCIIPARGGSKRIPRKNIREFCGKPMIAWSIEAAMASRCFDRIIVSTDDKEIADIAKGYGAEIPFMRPIKLADDFTGTIEVIAHAVNWLIEYSQAPFNVCCIYATAPFVKADDIKCGLEILNSNDVAYAFSITTYSYPIQRALRINQNQRVEMLKPENFKTRSQDFEEIWHDAAQFYWGRTTAWIEGRPFFIGDAAPVRIPRYRVQDIDTLEDWERAEWLFKAMQNN